MRDMKDSGMPFCKLVPIEWSVIPNRYLFIGHSMKVGEKSNEYQLLSLTTNGVKEKDINASGGKVPTSYDNYQTVEKGDMIFCLFDLDCSAVFSGLSSFDGMITSAYDVFKPNEKYIDKHFIEYWFAYVFSNRYYKMYSKSIRYTITSDMFKSILSPVPPIEQQRVIGNLLDEKCTQIDALIANQQKQIEKLKAYKQSLITETVTKGLNPDVPMKDSGVEWIGKIPEGWEIVRIKNICQFNPSSKKSFSDDDIVSYVPMECVRTGSLVHKEIAIKNVSSGLTYFEENDIIMAKVTPCFENGNIAIATGLTKGMAFGSSELFVFRANESIKFFLFYFLQNNIFKKFSISTMTGTGGLKRVSPNFVNNYSFALPPIEERNKIVFYLDKKCTQIDSLIAIKQRKIEKLQQYKKSLIYEYVTGKKEVK